MAGWYKNFYLITSEGEREMRAALLDPEEGGQNRADIQKRLDEMNLVPEDRCHITRDQRKFIERVLND